jgi:cyclopropane-fatty-acyl-phospholipid synthase
VQPGQRLLEIGCGWGGVAEYAARHFDAHVTGVTLSTEQLGYAQERLRAHGLAQRADLRLQDYRDLNDGPYDAIASIEMFEAVGREYWPGFFDQLRTLLKPGGRACLQTITIRDDLFERYTRSTDFIQQYIFPGGLLPSPQAFREQAERAGLRIVNELRFGADYAETLRRWRLRFLAEDAAVRRLRFDGRFMRIWEFYLAYCEAAFATGNTDVMQFTLERP